MATPHEILGVSENASATELRKARRNILYDLHPDRLPSDLPEGAARLIKEKILEVNAAYEELVKQIESNSGVSEERVKYASTGQDSPGIRNTSSSSKSQENHRNPPQQPPTENPSTGRNSAEQIAQTSPLLMLKKAFLKCSEGGGVDWGLAYLSTLALPDCLLAINSIFWKNESADSLIEFGRLTLAVPLFVVLINLAHGRYSLDRIWRRSFLVIATSLTSFMLIAIGTLFFVIPGILAAKNYFYSPFIAASDGCGPFEAMKRSVQHANVNGWRAFVAWTAATVITGGLYFLASELILLIPAEWAPGSFTVVFMFTANFGLSYFASIVLTVFGYMMLSNAIVKE